MIRYAKEEDINVLITYDKHIMPNELKNSIRLKRVLLMFIANHFIGYLRFSLFWDHIPFMNMLYLLEAYRGKGYGKQILDQSISLYRLC